MGTPIDLPAPVTPAGSDDPALVSAELTAVGRRPGDETRAGPRRADQRVCLHPGRVVPAARASTDNAPRTLAAARDAVFGRHRPEGMPERPATRWAARHRRPANAGPRPEGVVPHPMGAAGDGRLTLAVFVQRKVDDERFGDSRARPTLLCRAVRLRRRPAVAGLAAVAGISRVEQRCECSNYVVLSRLASRIVTEPIMWHVLFTLNGTKSERVSGLKTGR